MKKVSKTKSYIATRDKPAPVTVAFRDAAARLEETDSRIKMKQVSKPHSAESRREYVTVKMLTGINQLLIRNYAILVDLVSDLKPTDTHTLTVEVDCLIKDSWFNAGEKESDLVQLVNGYACMEDTIRVLSRRGDLKFLATISRQYGREIASLKLRIKSNKLEAENLLTDVREFRGSK